MLVEVLLAGSLSLCSTFFHSSPVLGSWTRDYKRACVKSVVGHRPLTGTLAVTIAGRASAAGGLIRPTFFSKGRFAMCRTHPLLILLYVRPKAQQSTTAAVLRYRCMYMAIGWVGG